jgi:glycosyltransferase involved in cell wall biosynthesis
MQFHGGYRPYTAYDGNDDKLLLWFLRKLLGLATYVVVISNEDAKFYRGVVSEIKLVRIANAVATTNGPPRDFGGDGLRLMYLGRLIEAKGLLDILEALAILKQMGFGDRLHLVVAGTGPLQETAQASVQSHGLNNTVRFVGAVFGPEKEELLANSDVLLLPTYHAERLPYALLEGMAAGLPPITCATGAIAEVIHHEREGLIVKPRDPAGLALVLAALESDRARLQRMSAACRQSVSDRYSVERMAGEFKLLYLRCRMAKTAGILQP